MRRVGGAVRRAAVDRHDRAAGPADDGQRAAQIGRRVAQQHQPEVTVAAVQRARRDADPVVPDHQPDPSLVAVHGDVHRVGARVLGHVERALPGAPVEERRHLRRERPPHPGRHRDLLVRAGPDRRGRDEVGQVVAGQLARVQLDQHLAQVADGPVQRLGRHPHHLPGAGRHLRTGAAGGEQERRAGELLDHAVVQVPGQQPALPLGSDQHGLQHPVPVVLRGRGPADQPDRHRQLGDGQDQQGEQRERHDPVGQLPLFLPDPAVGEEHLQHHLAAAGQRHRDVRLDQVRRGLLLGPLLGAGQQETYA